MVDLSSLLPNMQKLGEKKYQTKKQQQKEPNDKKRSWVATQKERNNTLGS
jgi:hypothetical protein